MSNYFLNVLLLDDAKHALREDPMIGSLGAMTLVTALYGSGGRPIYVILNM